MLSVAERFFAKIAKTSDGCWLWIGSRDDRGYGFFRYNGRVQMAHRVAWILANGQIPERLQVCHRCDNPRCVRAEHLFLGTAADNITDKVAKNRQARGDATGSRKYPERRPRGEKVVTSRLSADDVKAIRESAQRGSMLKTLAGQFGVSSRTIGRVVRREAWAHV